MRQAIPGEQIIDQFPVFEDDGYTKHSGLSNGTFVKSVWKDGYPAAVTVVVSEIGSSGDYKTRFTPNTTGFWHVEVLNSYNYEIWALGAEVRDASVDLIMAELGLIKDGGTGLFVAQDSLHFLKEDHSRILGLLHYNAIVDNQTYDPNSQLTSARLRVFDTKAHVPAVPGGSETLGLLHVYSVNAEYNGLGIVTLYRLRKEQ